MRKPPVFRFWVSVDRSGGPDDCWIWEGKLNGKGYGLFWIDPERERRPAHRFAYELLVGPIPEGLVIDHLCRNRACVNPSHLEPVTNRENILRGEGITARQARQTHCIYGHPFSEENTKIKSGKRCCRICDRKPHRKTVPQLSLELPCSTYRKDVAA